MVPAKAVLCVELLRTMPTFLIGLDALVASTVDTVVRGRLGSTVLKTVSQLVVFRDKVVDLCLNQTVLVVEHANVILKGFCLGE